MKAAYYEAYGDPSVVQIRDINKPVPGDDDVLVKVHGTLVSSGDARMRAFDLPALFRLPGRLMLGWPIPKKPVLGFAYSGVVDAVGKNVTTFKPGDEVLGGHVGGAHAEYDCVPARGPIVKKPAARDVTTPTGRRSASCRKTLPRRSLTIRRAATGPMPGTRSSIS